jgi:hypothetical protein
MHCSNPQCSKELLYLREGRLELVELERYSQDQESADDGGFPIKSLPSRFFWLCGECTKTHSIKRWTVSGVVLEAAPVEGAPHRSWDGRTVRTRGKVGNSALPISA